MLIKWFVALILFFSSSFEEAFSGSANVDAILYECGLEWVHEFGADFLRVC
jgi:hypothetical protein